MAYKAYYPSAYDPDGGKADRDEETRQKFEQPRPLTEDEIQRRLRLAKTERTMKGATGAASLEEKYKALVQFYDEHVGTPCEQIRHAQEIEHLTAQLAEANAAPPLMSWRCFHCNEVFETKEAAREHFGADEIAQTACQIDIAEYRRLEDQQAACRAECCEEATRYHAAEADHRRALVAEEQRGYDKGVADAHKEAAPPSIQEREKMLADALRGMLAEWDKFTRYGSPLAKAANENVNRAKAVIATLERMSK